MFHNTGFLSLPVAVFLVSAFVMGLLTFGNTNLYFDFAMRPIHGSWNNRKTLTVYHACHPVDFPSMQQ